MKFAAFVGLILFSNLSYADFAKYSKPLPKVNSDGSIIEVWRPQVKPGTNPGNPDNWEPYKFYFKNVDGTFQKSRTLNYPIDEAGANPEQIVYYYQDSALMEGVHENFALINTLTGSVIKKFPESPSPWTGATTIAMDDEGKKFCMLASHYAEVLDAEKAAWISFSDTHDKNIYDNDGGDLVVLPITSDGTWVTYMLAPKFQNFSMHYNYDIYRTNCFDSKQTVKIGSVPEFKVAPGDTGSSGVYVGMRMSAIKINEQTYIISRSPSIPTGAPAAFAKVKITNNGVKVLNVTDAINLFQIGFLAYDPEKNHVVAFGDWYKGHNKLSLNNAILNLTSMEVIEGAGVNRQANAFDPINKSRYTIRDNDLLTIGIDWTSLNPDWTGPAIHKTEIYDFTKDKFEFLQ